MNHHINQSPVVVAFGLQFLINTLMGLPGQIALLEIAYQKTVYLIQVCP